jgi:hypothetical protein
MASAVKGNLCRRMASSAANHTQLQYQTELITGRSRDVFRHVTVNSLNISTSRKEKTRRKITFEG